MGRAPYGEAIARPGGAQPEGVRGMPTFQNPVEDADEAREALRGLAYATRHFDAAEDTYPVLGSITRSVEGLQQVLEQLAAWHRTNQPSAASDTGDRAAGALEAVRAADALTRAAEALDRVWEAANAAWSHNGAITWQPNTPTTPPTRAPHPEPGRSGPGWKGRRITDTPPPLTEHGIGM
jgi:hypothetical protein